MKLLKAGPDHKTLNTDLYSIVEAVIEELDSNEKQFAPFILDRILNHKTLDLKYFKSLPDM